MPAYHSSFNSDTTAQVICNFPLLPLKTKYKGPAPVSMDAEAEDVVDEALKFFKANVLFRNYEMKGMADRIICYLTLYISSCLVKLNAKQYDKDSATKELQQLAIAQFAVPGDKTFTLGGMVTAPKSRSEQETLKAYITQLRHEAGRRLVEKVYQEDNLKPSKFWMCFSKRKFMNVELK